MDPDNTMDTVHKPTPFAPEIDQESPKLQTPPKSQAHIFTADDPDINVRRMSSKPSSLVRAPSKSRFCTEMDVRGMRPNQLSVLLSEYI